MRCKKSQLSVLLYLLVTLVGIVFATISLADSAGKRGKIIDFDDELVEGLNKRPLDSLSQISEKDRRKRKSHLYRKRAGFKSENSETMRTLRYTP